MRQVLRISPALAAAALASLVTGTVHAHFALQSPPNWAEQDKLGSPQKSAPCGQADAQMVPVRTNAVTTYQAGQVITVTIDEVVFHPGHYRVVLSTSGQAGLPADPLTIDPGTCTGLEIQNPPVFPVLADGVLVHTEPLDGPQSFSVKLPEGVTCTNCVLQVLEFMSVEAGSSPNCFYHHCADISIVAAGPSPGDSSEASCQLGGRAAPWSGLGWLACALPASTLLRRRMSLRRRRQGLRRSVHRD